MLCRRPDFLNSYHERVPSVLPRTGDILATYQKERIFKIMKAMIAGELETHFPEIVEEVRYGENPERKIGILDGWAAIDFKDDFEMTTEELCNL